MSEDGKRQLVWNKIDSYLSQYYLQYPDARIVPDH
jgi:hypothetical protein